MVDFHEDHRVFERFTARFPAKFEYSQNDFGTDVFLRDASAEGVKVTTKQKLFLNDSISIMIKLPDGENPLMLNGRVVWVHSKAPNVWEVGLRFHKIKLLKIHRLYKFVMESV